MSAIDPLVEFARIWDEAKRTPAIHEPAAMILATVGEEGHPSARVVLLRGLDARGFVFYTNLQSRKARDIAAEPFASLCFYWEPLGMQVRVEGRVEPVTEEEADEYWATRPRESQIGAWASRQSEPLDGRATLEARFEEIARRWEGKAVPRPEFWSGLRVLPARVELWHRGAHRLHDRDLYTRRDDGGWDHTRLYP